MTENSELTRILTTFQNPLRLNEGDIKTALNRYGYLKQMIRAKGYPDVKLALTSLYCYVRSPQTGRRVVGSHEFVRMCRESGLDLSTRDLWRYSKLFYEKELYVPITSPVSYFEAKWPELIKNFPLPPTMHTEVIALLKKAHLGGKRGAIVAAAVYTVADELRIYLSQKSLAEFFGITEVALRQNLGQFKQL